MLEMRWMERETRRWNPVSKIHEVDAIERVLQYRTWKVASTMLGDMRTTRRKPEWTPWTDVQVEVEK